MKTSIIVFFKYIDSEFCRMKKNLQMHIDDDNDIHRNKSFLSTHVPKEVMILSRLLLDTVINALMDEARSQLKGASVELQNRFYKKNFRKKVKEWTVQIENKLSLAGICKIFK